MRARIPHFPSRWLTLLQKLVFRGSHQVYSLEFARISNTVALSLASNLME